MRFSLIALALMQLVVGRSHAQGPQTVFAQLATNSSAADLTISIDPKYNLGQPFHLLTAVFSDAPGQTCTSVQPLPGNAGPFLDMLGRTVGTVDFSVITNVSRVIDPVNGVTPTNRYRILSSAAGAFPLLGAHFGNYDNVKCRISVFYSGGLVAIDIKKYTTFTTQIDQLRTFVIDQSTSGDHTIIPGVPNGRITVYALWIYNTTGPQSVTLVDHDTSGGNTSIAFFNGLISGSLLQMPNTNFPLFSTSLGSSLILRMSAATPVSGYIMFREE